MITNNVLRTRSSLVIQRVSHYVAKKLNDEKLVIDVSFTQILCKDKVLLP